MNRFFMLIGVPASGKTTILKQILEKNPDMVVISSDDYIQKKADEAGKTYGQVFQQHIKAAEANMYAEVKKAVAENKDIIWDQTNTTVKTRAKKLAEIPSTYFKAAIFLATPDDEELEKRLSSRPGKTIPKEIMKSMIAQLQEPTYEEGFDQLITNKRPIKGEIWVKGKST